MNLLSNAGITSEGSKNQQFWTGLLLVVAVSVYLGLYVFPINIHGDGFTHASIAEEIARVGHLVAATPHLVGFVTDTGVRVYSPINYPETAHVFMAVLFKFFGEFGLKLYSVVLAAISALMVFMTLRRLNLGAAAIAGFFVVLLNAKRFIITPLIEPFVVATFFTALFFYVEYFYRRRIIYLLFFIISAGAFLASKNIPLYIFPVTGLALLTHACIHSFQKKNKFFWITIIALFASIVVAIYPIANQLDRVGTLGYGQGKTRIPSFIPFHSFIQKTFFSSDVTYDQDIRDASDDIISYRLETTSFTDTVQRYFEFPIFYENLNQKYKGFWLTLMIVVVGSGLFVLLRRLPVFGAALFAALIMEIAVAYFYKQRVFQYHVVGASIIAILSVFGFDYLLGKVRYFPNHQIAQSLFVVTAVVLVVSGYTSYIHNSFWRYEGRHTPQERNAYQEVARYLTSHTAPTELILASGLQIGTFAQRDVIWQGARAYEIFSSDDINQSLSLLQSQSISYVLINTDQYNRTGVYDYLPHSGFSTYLAQLPEVAELLVDAPYLKNKSTEHMLLYKIHFTYQSL